MRCSWPMMIMIIIIQCWCYLCFDWLQAHRQFRLALSRCVKSTVNSIFARRSDVISTDNSFMHIGMTPFCRQIVCKFMRRCVFYFSWHNLLFKKLLDLQLHNKTIIGFGFRMLAKLSRPRFVLSQTQTSALIILAFMLKLIQKLFIINF